ncbi:unnamed protein product [Sphenostylis stenocarpa]|uniref:DUF7081 domain-containing protein n=1 Tax=Sphenostylis stenocarpa TaxID=92480 RepID=A0AA86SVI4_9FABA|nr:unnamed protein product [Sphenostylis stenocarpa]
MSLLDTHARTPTSCQDEKETLENESAIDSNVCKDVNLQPVSAHSSGEGLPYAPEGWPNPGDVWGWKVAARKSKGGYFYDRSLTLPASLQKGSRKLELRSKADIKRYLKSNFPNMTIEAFFTLFSWLVPSAEQTPKGENATDDTVTQRNSRWKMISGTHPTGEDAADGTDTQRKSKRKMSSGSQPTGDDATDDAGTRRKSGRKTKSGRHPTKKSLALVPVDSCLTPDQVANFDAYLDNLENMLVMPHIETTPLDQWTCATVLDMESIECCKKKLSSLLALDFPSLVSSNDVAEVATLASQIREDPCLSVDQLFKLKLVEQVPLAGEAFLDAKDNIEEADKFMADLVAKKLKVPSLKKEYNLLKDKVAEREAEMDISVLSLKEIDDQILQLQSKRNRISGALETMQKDKGKLTSELTKVANSISTLVHEIQSGLSQKSKWDLKKANNVRRVAEIQEKFLTLRGLTF